MLATLFAFVSVHRTGLCLLAAYVLVHVLAHRAGLTAWARVRAPRLYAFLAAHQAAVGPAITTARYVLAIFRPSLLAQLEGVVVEIQSDASRVTPDLGLPPHLRTARRPPPIPPVLVLLVLALGGCGAVHSVAVTGTVSSDGGNDWTAGVGVTIVMAEAADPVLRQVADNDGQLTAAQHADVDTALTLAADALVPLDTALGGYERIRDLPHQCQLHAALDTAIDHRLQVITLLGDFGIQVPPLVTVVVGALGSIADSILPGCIAPGARPMRAMDRIHRALAGGSPR